MSDRIEMPGRSDISEPIQMSDWHEIIETVLMKFALTLLFGLVGWAGTVVAIGLLTGAMRGLVDAPPLAWASENATVLALALTAILWIWLRFRPSQI